MIAYLFLVQSGLFNNSSLSPYAFASVGTREEVGGTIIAVDWVWYGFGDARANFYAVADAGGSGVLGTVDSSRRLKRIRLSGPGHPAAGRDGHAEGREDGRDDHLALQGWPARLPGAAAAPAQRARRAGAAHPGLARAPGQPRLRPAAPHARGLHTKCPQLCEHGADQAAVTTRRCFTGLGHG